MGGSESQRTVHDFRGGEDKNPTKLQGHGFTAEDIAAFAGTGYQGADKLAGAGRKVAFGKDGSGYYLPGPVHTNEAGENLDTLVMAFQNWQTQQKDSSKKHEAYLKEVADKPGRSGTILTSVADASKTILGR